MLKTSVLAASLSMLASLAGAAEGGVAGSYDVTGKYPDGSPYTGTVEIRASSNDTCTITWQLGSDFASGVCVRNGRILAASWQFHNKVGVVVFEIKDDGSMVGPWTIADDSSSGTSGSGTEVLTPKH
jgi:hypothetical protein